MGIVKVSEVLKDATKVAYRDEYEYCRRAIRAIMAVVGPRGYLLDKEVEILTVMCKMCIEGGDYMSSRAVIGQMAECGVEVVSMGTMRNYRTKLKKRGWLDGRQFNMLLRRAIANGGISVGIFLHRDAEKGKQ